MVGSTHFQVEKRRSGGNTHMVAIASGSHQLATTFEMEANELMKLKEFCRLTHLSRKALLIYEEKGILRPARTDPETGYRFYGEEELRRATLLAFLKNFELSLEDMQKILENEISFRRFCENTSRRRVLRARYLKTVHALQALTLAENDEHFLIQKPVVKVYPEYSALTLIGSGTVSDITTGISLMLRFAAQIGAGIAGPLSTWYLADSTPGKYHYKICYPVEGYWNYSHPDIIWERIPSVKCAVMRHFGDYELLPDAYSRLRAACAERQWRLSGEYTEAYVIAGDRRQTDPSTFVTDISAVLA